MEKAVQAEMEQIKELMDDEELTKPGQLDEIAQTGTSRIYTGFTSSFREKAILKIYLTGSWIFTIRLH